MSTHDTPDPHDLDGPDDLDRHDDRALPAPIRTQAELEQTWRTLMEPLGFGGASVWMMLIGPDDRPLRHLTEITETGTVPTDDDTQAFAAFLAEGVATNMPDGRVALLRSRPGRHGTGPDDLAWAQSLYAACTIAGLRADVVHLATDAALVPLPLDALPSATLRPTG